MPFEAPSRTSAHPIKIGTDVAVFIIADDGQPIFEGWARIVSGCISYGHWYRVRFRSEQLERIRLIFPASVHDDPVLSAELLREFCRTRGLSPIDDFFPAHDKPRRLR
jgi:hypothetical protein